MIRSSLFFGATTWLSL